MFDELSVPLRHLSEGVAVGHIEAANGSAFGRSRPTDSAKSVSRDARSHCHSERQPVQAYCTTQPKSDLDAATAAFAWGLRCRSTLHARNSGRHNTHSSARRSTYVASKPLRLLHSKYVACKRAASASASDRSTTRASSDPHNRPQVMGEVRGRNEL